MQHRLHSLVEVECLSDLDRSGIRMTDVTDEDRAHVLNIADGPVVEDGVAIEVDALVKRLGGCCGIRRGRS
nr:hypothetical protein [uncultured Microbacterium sp.]